MIIYGHYSQIRSYPPYVSFGSEDQLRKLDYDFAVRSGATTADLAAQLYNRGKLSEDNMKIQVEEGMQRIGRAILFYGKNDTISSAFKRVMPKR